MSSQKKYDVILIGSGPICIIEACYLKKQGKKVLILEERDKASGAWSTVHLPQLPEVEIGCHIWDVTPKAYRFLSDFFGLELLRLSPQPRINKNGRRYPYDWKRNAFAFKQIIKHTGKLKFKQLSSDLKHPQFRISLLPDKYLYPKWGAKDLKNGISKKIKDYDLEINFQEKVLEVKQSVNGIEVMSISDSYHCEKLIITSLSQVNQFNLDQDVIHPNSQSVKYIHCHLLIKGPLKKAFSYERVMGNPLIHRISDMTFQVKNEIEKDECLICCGLFEESFNDHPEKDIPERCINELKKLSYLSEKNKLVHSGINVFPSYYNDLESLKQLEQKTNGKIQVLRSTNFTYSINQHASRWRNLLLSSNK